MAQSTICEVTTSTLHKMERKLCPLKIKFMPSASESIKTHFYEKFRIPGVIGCVDGTHIMILRPTENEHIFFNRKGRHSINTMVICDHKMKILAINAKYGGSAHDSFVWRQSAQRNKLNMEYCSGVSSSWLLGTIYMWTNYSIEASDVTFYITGDSGYPLEPFLLTPYRSATLNSPESRFNKTHAQARSIVERCIGVMKSRWRSILEERKLRYSPKRAAQIINVCAALHNICIENGEPLLDDFASSHPISDNGTPHLHTIRQNDSNEGTRIRNRIRDDLWVNHQALN
ncbi:putative nuclease HARBI1 isoform X2 [Episyrphus balteatus]|uniref:putative nuclease HARBI1 isoform X2 n=1 Tax=Episyrphus balteatus TaxID=286459 RepID=UPI002486AE54|nr:putative nuclease HARBI1 isoform X2 [Episyrphus balteatus]